MSLRTTIASLVMGASLALGATAAHADTTKPATDADIKKWLAFFDKIVDTVVRDAAACPKMAVDINKVIDDNKDLIDMANKHINAGEKLPPDAQNHMMDGVKRMTPGLQKCGQDANVQKAIQRLPKGPGAHGGPPPAK